MMAEADGKLTGRPGIAMVTRGPGATNAASGVHVAQQDSTPMLLLVGQIGRRWEGRDAFQEVDYVRFYSGMAKWVAEIRDAARIPEMVSRAFHVAMSGRPGPVVLALPEDMLRETVVARPAPRVDVDGPQCSPNQARAAAGLLRRARRPIVVAGGSRWNEAAIVALHSFAESWRLPVAVTFRRQNLFSASHANYAGDLGLGPNPELAARVREADLVLLIGGRFSENPSQAFTLFDIPKPKQQLIHIHPGAEELGRIYAPDLAINATPGSFLDAMAAEAVGGGWDSLAAEANASYRAWTATLPPGKGTATMSATIAHFREAVAGDAILCNGAGNYAIWLNRYVRFRPALQLAPTSGSMGYGLPAAVAAALRHPNREVFAFAGDGCFQMTSQEFAVAAERKLQIRVIVCDNSLYGTIRMHQERDYPGRPVATSIRNPDFAAWARSYGVPAFAVAADGEFPAALAAARKAEGTSLIHLKLDPRDIAPGRFIEAATN
jgi:acetolactate synthase-1/2/3 large subunit